MKLFYSILFLTFFFQNIYASPSAQSKLAITPPQTSEKLKFKDLPCEQLLSLYQEKTHPLFQLAGIRAHKKCKTNDKFFIFDNKTLTDIEVKFFANEFAQANIDISKITSGTETIKDDSQPNINILKLKLKLTSKVEEKLQILKDIRDFYKNKKNAQQLLATQLELFKFSMTVLKANKENSSGDLNTTKEKNKKIKKNSLQTDQLKSFADAAIDSGIIYARNQWRNQEDDKALEVLNQINSEVFDKTNLVDIYYLSALIYEDKEQYAEASLFYEKALSSYKELQFKNAPIKSQLLLTLEKLLWRKAWLFYKNKQWVDAENNFNKLVNSTYDISEKIRARFFQARSLKQLNKLKEAESLFTLNTKEDFFSFYSLASYRELNQKIPPFSLLKYTGTLDFENGLNYLKTDAKKIFVSLIENEEFDILEYAIPRLSNKPDELIFLNIKYAESSQKYFSLFVNFAKLEQKQKQDVLVRYPHLIFPRPYLDEVKEMAQITELPTSLIYSIMKQESGFNSQIKSHANAYGLMQVIPALAKHLAKKFKLPYRQTQDLLIPELNIKLGSYELAEQVKKQNQQYVFVTSAYNAGPNALTKWLKTKYKSHFDTIDFIEEIPYDETKVYAKVIARNFIFYSLIEKPTESLTFPENFVKPFNQ